MYMLYVNYTFKEQTKNFYSTKDTINRIKSQATGESKNLCKQARIRTEYTQSSRDTNYKKKVTTPQKRSNSQKRNPHSPVLVKENLLQKSREYKWNQESPPLLLWDWQWLETEQENFSDTALGVIQPLWKKVSLNQEKFTTGSFYAPEIHTLEQAPQDKLVYKCTKGMHRETQPVTERTEDALHGQQPQKVWNGGIF